MLCIEHNLFHQSKISNAQFYYMINIFYYHFHYKVNNNLHYRLNN